MKRLLLVAHPDDEVLWFGGRVLSFPGDWTIICCSIPRSDPIRAYKFFDACQVLGAAGRLLPFTEPDINAEFTNLDAIDLSSYDEITTHNDVGEYGHRHHIALNRFVAERCPDKMVTDCYGKPNAGRRLLLDDSLIKQKMAALTCYDHVSKHDKKKPKWQALLDRYNPYYDLSIESYEG